MSRVPWVSQITISRKHEFRWGIPSKIMVLGIYHSREDEKCQKVFRRMLTFSGPQQALTLWYQVAESICSRFFFVSKGKHPTPLTPVLLIMETGLTCVLWLEQLCFIVLLQLQWSTGHIPGYPQTHHLCTLLRLFPFFTLLFATLSVPQPCPKSLLIITFSPLSSVLLHPYTNLVFLILLPR